MEAGVKLLDRLTPAQREQLARLLPRLLPFADAASADLPLPRLLRLSLFQVSVGLAMALMVQSDMATPIIGRPRAPGTAQTTCDMNTANCTL